VDKEEYKVIKIEDVIGVLWESQKQVK
jgi:hypothetical protein